MFNKVLICTSILLLRKNKSGIYYVGSGYSFFFEGRIRIWFFLEGWIRFFLSKRLDPIFSRTLILS